MFPAVHADGLISAVSAAGPTGAARLLRLLLAAEHAAEHAALGGNASSDVRMAAIGHVPAGAFVSTAVLCLPHHCKKLRESTKGAGRSFSHKLLLGEQVV